MLWWTEVSYNASNQNINRPFRQKSNIAYYIWPTGYESSLISWATIDIWTWETTLYWERMTDSKKLWEGDQQRIWVNTYSNHLDIRFREIDPSRKIPGIQEKESMLRILKDDGRPLLFFPEDNPAQQVQIVKHLQQSFEEVQNGNSKPLRKAIIEQRLIKSPEEIEKLKEAWALTKKIFMHLLQVVTPNRTEAEVDGEIQKMLCKFGAAESFWTIASTNWEVLHNRKKWLDPMWEWHLLLVDTWVQPMHHNYCGDQTLAFPTGKKFTEKQAEIFELVVQSHKDAVKACAVNKNFKDIHFVACITIIEGLKEAWILQWDTEKILASWAHALFFPHGLWHAIGLDDHDLWDSNQNHVWYPNWWKETQFWLRSLRFARDLEVGHCFSIEPWIYFIERMIEKRETDDEFACCRKYINFDKSKVYAQEVKWIRFEECYAMTENWIELLSDTMKPDTVEEIEQLREKAFTM